MSEQLSERYGTHRPGRRALTIGVVAVVAVVALVWLAWAVWLRSTPEVSSALVSYDVRGNHSAVATFKIELGDPDVTGSCLLRATARDHTTVGELNADIADLLDDQRSNTVTIRTERRATAIELVGCTTPDQHQPR